MSRITVITGQYDQIIDAPMYDEAGRPVTFTDDAAGVSFIVYTPDTPEESRLVLPPSRYKDGRIYIDAAELQSLTAGELFMTVELSAAYEGYTDGTFDTGYTVQLQKYLKTDNPPKSTYDRIADLNKAVDGLRLDASYAGDVHDELRAMDASLADAITALRRGQDGLERAVADVSASVPEIPEIPNKVSQLVNDCSFVTKDRVDGIDLALQDACTILGGLDASVKDVYTKAEVNQMISGLTSLDMEVVDELPAQPDLHTIYLLKEGGLYGQYFYNTKVNDYVRISDTGVDLTAYLTKAEAAQTYATESGMTERIQGAVNTGVYTAEAVAAEMDASVLAASRTYTDASLSLLRGDVSLLESQVDDFTEAVTAVPGIEQRLGALEASVGNIQPAGPSFRKITVNALPAAAEADPDALYFLQSSSEANNVYTEYTIVNGQWEIVGWAMSAADGSVDTTGLVNDAQLALAVSEANARMDAADASLKNYVDDLVNNIDVSVDLSGYATREQLDASLLALGDKADKSDTYTKAEVDDRIAAAAIDPSVILDDYVKAGQAEALIQEYDGSTNARIDALDASVRDVYTKAEVDGLLSEVSPEGYATTEDVSAADAALAAVIGDVSAYAHSIAIPEGADVSKGYVDAQDASIVDWIDASVTAGLDLILSGEYDPGYDDTEVRGLIADVSGYAHGLVIPEIPADNVTDASFLVNTLTDLERRMPVVDDNPRVFMHQNIKIGLGIPYYRDEADHEEVRHKEILNIEAGPGIMINTVAGSADSSISVNTSVIATRQFVTENAYNDASVRADIEDVSSYAHSIEIPEAYDDTSVTQAIEDVSVYAHGLTIPAAYNDAELRALIADVSTFSHSLRSGSPFQVVSTLPAAGEADDSLIYLYPDAAGANNAFTEYVAVNGQWEIIGQGSLNVDLTQYAKDASLQAAVGQINDVSASLAAANAELADVSTYAHSLVIPEEYDDTSVTNRLTAHDASIGGLDASLSEMASRLADVSAAVADSSYTLPCATDDKLGGFKTGFQANNTARNYPVLLNSADRAYVNVPWEAGGVSAADVSSMISTALSDGNYLTSSSLTGLATETYVQNYVSGRLQDASYLTQHQSLKTINGYSLVGTGNIQVTQDLTGYATQSWVNTQLAGVGGGLDDASVRAIADAYDTSMQSYVQGAVSGVTGGGLSDASIRSIIESYGYMQAASYADVARQSWVEERIVDLTSGGTVDLASYASKTYVDTSIQSVKTWVGQQGYLTSHQSLTDYVTKSMLDASWAALPSGGGDTSVDLSGYYTKTEIDNKGYLTAHQSLSDYVMKSMLDASYAAVDASLKALDASAKAADASLAALDASVKAVSAGSAFGAQFVECTQVEYNQMSSHDANTLYIITANQNE